MSKKLKTDKDFMHLIYPMDEKDRFRLVASLLKHGCIDPITVWNDTIVDGHKRYEICKQHNIPFNIESTSFDCKESAMMWICRKEIERPNLPYPMKKYLMGLYYRLSKYTSGRLLKEKETLPDGDYPRKKQDTAELVAKSFHLSAPSIRKYARFSKAVDRIEKKVPGSYLKLLSGQCKISHDKLYDLSLEPASVLAEELKKDYPFKTKLDTMKTAPTHEIKQPSVKDMPAFDPDGAFTELSLTIPFWTKSINRTATTTDVSLVSSTAINRLLTVLSNHKRAIDELIKAIKE